MGLSKACLPQPIISFSLAILLALAVSACAEGIPPLPTNSPLATPGAQATATNLPPLGAASTAIVANAPTPMPNNEAVIDTVEISLLESMPVQVNALIKGKLPDACVKIERMQQQLVGNTFIVTVLTRRQPDVGCIAQLQPFEQRLPLEAAGLPNGTYTVTISGTNSVSSSFVLSQANQIDPPPPVEEPCVDQAAYVADVTIADNTPLAPGEPFVKTWRIQNIGTCTWEANYALVFTGGEAMGGPATVSLPQVVQPGSEIDLSVALIAPANAGIYRGEWKLRNGSGGLFGSRGDFPFHVQIMVGRVVTTPTAQLLAINGVVWDDYCQLLESGLLAGSCILAEPGGQMRADGLFDRSERGLAGVQVKLSVGECPGNNFVFTTTTTDNTGSYHFGNLQAGPHCVSIDARAEPNAFLLQPGAWTYPAPGVSEITIIVGAGQSQSVDFGWDYQ